MNRNDYLEHFLSLLQLMRYQTTLPAKEIDGPFFWRCSNLLHESKARALGLGAITFEDNQEVQRIADEIKDQYEVAVSPLFPDRQALFFSDLFRSVAKDAKGFPLQPVRLCSLLEQNIFKELSAVADACPGTSINFFNLAGRDKPIESGFMEL